MRAFNRPGPAAALLLLLPLLLLAGCGENFVYIITDEPDGTSVGGISLTDDEVAILKATEVEARARLLAGDYAEAAEAYQRQAEVLTGHFAAQYKAAAAFAMGGRHDDALHWLELAVDNGFANVGKMDTDPAWESMHGDERAIPLYRNARENMTILRTRTVPDPWTMLEMRTATTHDDLASLLAAHDREEQRLADLDGVFFPREQNMRQILAHLSKAVDLEAFIAAGPSEDQARQARLELLRLYRTHAVAQRPSAVAEARLDEGCRRFITDYSDGPNLPEARLIHAEYRYISTLRSLAGPRREEIPNASESFRGEVERIVADAPGTPAAGLAQLWLTELAFHPRYRVRDLALALEHYRTLKQDYIQLPEVAEQAAQRVSALAFFDDGVPSFEATDVNGEPFTIETYRGKVLVLFFWATTSAPARDEIANLKWIEEKFREKEVAVAGVSLDQGGQLSAGDFTRWLEGNSVSWPQVYDGKGIDGELARLFGVRTVPYVFVFGRDGALADAGLTGKDLELAVGAVVE
jgi:hypothetical protein